jgi:IS66 C-terminal element
LLSVTPMPVNAARSFTRSSKAAGVEPYTYLHDVLGRLPSMTNRQVKDIVLKAWAAATKNTPLRAA